MEEEKRIVTMYNDVDYDGSIEKLKESLKKYDATLKAANEDEFQIEIAKSKLEDFCDDFDLDIDDITEEWDSYTTAEQAQQERSSSPEFAAYVGKIDKKIDDFDLSEFIENARQNKHSVETRLQNDDVVIELYIDFEDEVYVELWQIAFSKDEDQMNADSTMLYSNEFDENDMTAWKKTENELAEFFPKRDVPEGIQQHVRHHETKDTFPRPGFSAEGAMLIDEAENAASLSELEDIMNLARRALDLGDIDNQEYERIKRVANFVRHNIENHVEDAEYEYDEKLAKEILDEILEGANADVPQHIDYAISSRGGKVDSMRIAPDSIYVIWHLKDFKAANRIYLERLDEDVARLTEDIAHAVGKESTKDSFDLRTEKGKEYEKRMKMIFIPAEFDDIYDEIVEDKELDEEDRKTLKSLVGIYEDRLYNMSEKADDSSDKRHVVDIKTANMKDVAQVCDIFDDAEIKYNLTEDSLTVHCGPQQWKELQTRFKVLQGE